MCPRAWKWDRDTSVVAGLRFGSFVVAGFARSARMAQQRNRAPADLRVGRPDANHAPGMQNLLSPSPIRSVVAAIVATLLLAVPPCAQAELLGSGPALMLGYSPDEDASGTAQDLALIGAGWRWRFDGHQSIDDFLAKGKIDFSWAVEPLAGVVCGDAEAFEASVVPYVQLRPLGWEGVVPWLELGVGIAYTGLRNYGMGSRVNFSDNVGVGLAFGSGDGWKWSVGYRFRHLSHAGILDDRNEGLNAHFLTFSME